MLAEIEGEIEADMDGDSEADGLTLGLIEAEIEADGVLSHTVDSVPSVQLPCTHSQSSVVP